MQPLFTLEEMIALATPRSSLNVVRDGPYMVQSRMNLIEGGEFIHPKQFEEAVEFAKTTVNGFPSVYAGINWSDEDEIEWFLGHFENTAYFGNVVYGGGGWNRYFIRYNGDVYLSKYHADEKSLQRAKAIGFPIN